MAACTTETGLIGEINNRERHVHPLDDWRARLFSSVDPTKFTPADSAFGSHVPNAQSGDAEEATGKFRPVKLIGQ